MATAVAAILAIEAEAAAPVAALVGALRKCAYTLWEEWDDQSKMVTREEVDVLLSDLSAAAEAHDAEVARRAVEDALTVERIEDALDLVYPEADTTPLLRNYRIAKALRAAILEGPSEPEART
jgi:hypothetical protein